MINCCIRLPLFDASTLRTRRQKEKRKAENKRNRYVEDDTYADKDRVSKPQPYLELLKLKTC
jgi:hypothetical protein